MDRLFVTSPPPAWPLLDSVGNVSELQVHSWAFGEVGEALCFSDLVLNLLQVDQHGCFLLLLSLGLAASVTYNGLLHWDAHRIGFQRLIVHTRSLSVGGRLGKKEREWLRSEGQNRKSEQRSAMVHYLMTCLISHLWFGIRCLAGIFGTRRQQGT